MRHYIGIDLGTTNSSICSFDGKETHVWKSPEQADVTPSAIYIDRRGHRFFGRKAFEMASSNEKNAATLFKRYLGTSKVFEFADAQTQMTPVECSAELLKVLYGYLPEEIRKDPETVTVITVPSAFNQMKKDATLEAARLAGIGQTALMQEPVAAVMSVLKKDQQEKLFLIYDLGGGTFDVSVAQHIGGHVSLLAQGGREMCGGRDMDRWIYRQKILPWLQETFRLPDDPDTDQAFLGMKRTALFAAEEAKISLSSSEEPVSVWVDEDTLRTKDLDGADMYLDLTISREDLEEIVAQMAEETAELTRETMARAGVNAGQMDQIVFIGGPTMYAPLREQVCAILGIERGTAVNPMTAVAEGASIYAETIDWSNDQHRRRESIEEIHDQPEVPKSENVTIRYESRTSSDHAKIALLFEDDCERFVRIVTDASGEGTPGAGAGTARPEDGGTAASSMTAAGRSGAGAAFFDSGKIMIRGQGIVEVTLPAPGRYPFLLEIYREAADSEELPRETRQCTITRTLASIASIPASHSIAVKALDKPGGVPVPVYLVQVNDPLPKNGSVTFRAAEQLVGGSSGALSFSLWEGEIRDPVDDNRYIGTYRIPGTVFSGGVVPVGAEVICDYEMNEAGNLRLGVSIPCVGLRMREKNFYSRYEGQIDLKDTYALVNEAKKLLERTAQMKQSIVDEELDAVRRKLMGIRSTFTHSQDPESIAEAESELMNCYRRVAILHQRYANVIKSRDLDEVISRFRKTEDKATEDEAAAFQNLVELARFSIDMGSSDFESQLSEMREIIAEIRWRQDDVIRNIFLNMTMWPGNFQDRAAFDRLRAEGLTCLENGNMQELRRVVNDLFKIERKDANIQPEKMFDEVSVYRS